MRAPVISRFAATTVATLALGLPLLTGAAPAWADSTPAGRTVSAQQQAKHPVWAFLPPAPTTVAAGGDRIEIGLEVANFTGAAFPSIAPDLKFRAAARSADGTGTVGLRPEDVTLEVMVKGTWTRVPLTPSGEPALYAETFMTAGPLADGHATRYMFRLGLSAKVPVQLKTLEVISGGGQDGRPSHLTVAITHPGAAAGTPSTAAAITRTTAASAAGPAAQLASTGPSAPITFLLASSAALLALGGGLLYAMKRIAQR